MYIKMLPKKWDRMLVVSFHTLQPSGDDPAYVGAAMLEEATNVYTVVRLGADSMDNGLWRAIGTPLKGLTWSEAQSAMQSRIQGGSR